MVPACDDAKPEVEERPVAATVDEDPSLPQDRGWRTGTSSACGFEVAVPWGPTFAPKDPRVLDQVASERPGGRMAVIASCADMGKVKFDADVLEVSARGVMVGLGGKGDTTTPVEYEARQGLEAAGTVAAEDKPAMLPWSGPLHYHLRIFVSGSRQYQLLMLAAEDDAELARDWFQSFHFGRDAPPPTPPDAWTRRELGAWTIEGPGEAKAVLTRTDAMKQGLTFEGNRGETGYSASLWPAQTDARLDTTDKRLRAHFLLHVASEHTEIEAETFDDAGKWPWLEITYRIAMPVPDHLAADDPAARQVVREMAAERPLTYRVRLYEGEGEIVQLEADTRNREDRVTWFLGSLERGT